MTYVRTRAQLLDRIAADRQENYGTDSTFSRANARRYLDESWEIIWDHLSSRDTSYSIRRQTITVTTLDYLQLPSDFVTMRQLRVKQGARFVPYDATSWVEMTNRGVDPDVASTVRGSPSYGRWLRDVIDGPPRQEVLRFFPQLSEGTQVSLVYHRSPTSLANSDGTYGDTPGDAEDATIEINLYQASLADVLVGMARARAANRGDQKEYQLGLAQAAGQMNSALDRIKAAESRSDRPPRPLITYARRRIR